MKGIMSIIEVMITGVILLVAFLHFFPQYSIRSKWDMVLLDVKVMDTINTIDRLDKTHDFATSSNDFENFMERLFSPEAVIYWKEVRELEGYTEDMSVPYFTQGQKESIVEVELVPQESSVDPDTVALWHFNEGSGCTVSDETLNNNDGTLKPNCPANSPTWTEGKFDDALRFDGDDYVEVPTSDSLNPDYITIDLWIKPASDKIKTTGSVMEGMIVKKIVWANKLGYFLQWRNASASIPHAVQLYIGNGASWKVVTSSDESVPLNQWTHVVGTYDGNLIRIYINGVPDGSNTHTGLIAPSTDVLRIGAENSTYKIFNGTIDEVKIYNRALNEDEIRNNYFGSYDVYSFTLGLGYPY